MNKIRFILFLLWGLSLSVLLTPKLNYPFTFFEPFSLEYYAIVFWFIASSFALIKRTTTKILVRLHLFVVLFMILLHPNSTFFGRDGTLIVLSVYFIFALWKILQKNYEYKLLFTSFLLSLFLLESGISVLAKYNKKSRIGLKDYGDMVSGFREGGFLLPNLDLKIIGEFGEARAITNKFGFRNAKEVEYKKPSDLQRIILLGDSFVVGFRTDQKHTVGKILENRLNEEIDQKFEVLIAGSEHPGQYQDYINQHAFKFNPDIIIIGITLGNDISQAYLSKNGLSFKGEKIKNSTLPSDAFRINDFPYSLFLRLDRSFQRWKTYKNVKTMINGRGIGSWYQDYPGEVHLFDAFHSLGHFYSGNIPIIEESFQALHNIILDINNKANENNSKLLVVIFPQRFQINKEEWNSVSFSYGLNRNSFDINKPNNTILEFCSNNSILCLDLVKSFDKESNVKYFLPKGEMHWNSAGQRMAALTIKKYIVKNQLYRGFKSNKTNEL